jgi:hypothetical protein
MYAWSDQTARRPAGGTALYLPMEQMVGAGSRVLIAGPHDHYLVRRLTRLQASVTWLTRSYVDATEASEKLRELGDVQILTGSLSKLPTDTTYDMVIALDGLGRLCSAEGITLNWAESLDMLLRVLNDDGILLLSVDNPVGVHQLIQPDPWYADRSDSAWLLAEQIDPTKPTTLPDVIARLAANSLNPIHSLGAFPEPTQPTALISADLLGPDVGPSRRAALADIVKSVSLPSWQDQPLLLDPQWLTSNAVRNGLGAGLAASWVVVAGRRAGQTTGSRVVITDHKGVADWGFTYTLTPSGEDAWERRALFPDRARAEGTLVRDPARLNGMLPAGQVLQEALTAFCLRHDRVGLRRALTTYADWLRQLVESGDPSAPFATPRNVACMGDTFQIRDTSWQVTSDWPFDVVLANGLREFAVELLTGGYNHPWPSTVDANQLTIILGAIAGFDVEMQMIDHAVAAEVDVYTIVNQLDDDARREFAHKLGEAGSTSGAIETLSFQRLRQAHARQADEIASLRDKVKWLDHLLVSRERSLRRAQSQINSLNSSISFRVGRAIISPAIATRTLSRRTMKRLRSSGKIDEISFDD